MAINITTYEGTELVTNSYNNREEYTNSIINKEEEDINEEVNIIDDIKEEVIEDKKEIVKKEKDEFDYLNEIEEATEEEVDPIKKELNNINETLLKEKRLLEERLYKLENNNNNKVEENIILEEPNLEDFDDHKDYVKALAKYEYKIERQKELMEEASKKIATEWNSRCEEASKKYKDWNDIKKAENVPLSPIISGEIMESEIGTDILYYLFKNPHIAVELANLPAAKQLKLFGKIEDKINNKLSSNVVEKETKAPSPVNPINTNKNKATINKDPSNMTFQEHKKWRESQLKKK